MLFWPTFANGNNPQIFDPATGSFSTIAPAGYNIFCSGHSYTADGKILVTGGHIVSNFGYAHATLFDPATLTWSQVPDMWGGRWYPTNTTLPNGDIVTMSGVMNPSDGLNPMTEVWRHETNTWQQLFNAQLVVPFYPRLFVAPNGKLIMAGTGATTRYLDTSDSGAWTVVGNTNFNKSRDYGSAVMYGVGKILLMGGGDAPTATAETIDLTQPTPVWTYTASMSQPRRQLNATILPDGTVLATGGSSASGFDTNTSPVLTPELWNPATGTWSMMASSTTYRGYHSIALLLPDGRVLSAGGNDINLYRSGEIFSPPYLFNGARPTITSAPSSILWGSIATVSTPDAASISKVTLVSLASVTHAFNMNQTFANLSFSITSAGDGLSVLSPASGNVAPPGPYLLFIINSAGVPSVAAQVSVGGPVSTPGPVSVVPSSIAFSTIVTTTSSPTPIVITNTQSVALNFQSIAIPAPFMQTNNCDTVVAAGASCTVNITYSPTAASTDAAKLTITDDVGTSPQTVAVQGLGLLPVVVSPASLTFGKYVVGTSSSKKTFNLKNNLNVPLTLSSITVTGADFILAEDPNTPCVSSSGSGTVVASYFCRFNVKFTPTVIGPRTGSVTIIDSAGTSPQIIQLKGIGG